MCVCMHSYVCGDMHVYTHVYGDQKSSLGVIPRELFTLSFETDLS